MGRRSVGPAAQVCLAPLLALAALGAYLVMDQRGGIDRPPPAIAAAGTNQADAMPWRDSAAAKTGTKTTDTMTVTFSYCGAGVWATCVVDGDTFWFSREKRIRIADIDTPELHPPRCEAERIRGEKAKRRLRELLNAGPFSLVSDGQDEDQYGRKLRIVMRAGRSIGDMLVQEGLARRWDGARHGWCNDRR